MHFSSLLFFTIFSSLIIRRIQYIIYVAYKICVKQLCILLLSLPVKSRLFVLKFLGSQNFTWIPDYKQATAPIPTLRDKWESAPYH